MRRLKHHRSSLWALLAAVALGAALATACAGLLETALRLDAPPTTITAPLVVTGAEHATLRGDAGAKPQAVTLDERRALPAGAAAIVAGTDGVARATVVERRQAIAVTPRPGAGTQELAERIADRIAGTGLTVLSGSDRGRAEATGVAGSRLKLILLAAIFGGLALVVMAILLFAIVGLAIEQRTREIGLLRTIGATPKQVGRMVVRGTMRPALVAAAAGAVAALPLADALFTRVRDAGVVPGVLVLRQGPISIAAGLLATLLVVRASVQIAARRAARAELAEALGEVEARPGAIGPLRAGFGLLTAAAAVSCAAITMFMPPENAAATGGGTALAGALAFAAFAPVLTSRLAVRLAGPFVRWGGFSGELAVDNVRARPHRTAVLVTPVVLLAAVALANVYQQSTQAHAMRSAYLGTLKADAVVTGAVTPGTVAAVQRAGAVSPVTTSSAWIEQPVDRSHRIDPRTLVGADPSAVARHAAQGSLAGLRGNAVALPRDVAGKLGVRVGETVGLVLGDGAHVRTRVLALLDGSGRYGSIVVPGALAAAHVTGGRPQTLAVNGPHAFARTQAALAGRPGVHVRGAGALAGDYDDGLQVDAWITFAVVGVILAYAAMSLVHALVAALAGRRREIALLRMAGATRRQLRRMLQAEALLIGVIGVLAGTVTAIVGLVPLAIAQAGTPLPSGPAWFFPALVAVVAALVLVPTTVVFGTTLNPKKVSDASL